MPLLPPPGSARPRARVQAVVVPQFLKVARNGDTGEVVFALTEDYCVRFGIAFVKPPTCKQARPPPPSPPHTHTPSGCFHVCS